MNPSPPSNAWPQPQSVAAWYQQFAHPPRRILVGTIQLQQVELLLQHSTREPLGPIPLNILRCVQLRGGFRIKEIAERMQLSESFVRSMVDALRRTGDVDESPEGIVRLTQTGQESLTHGTPRTDRRRQLFDFRNGHYLGENSTRLLPGPSEPSDFDGTKALRQAKPDCPIAEPNSHDWMTIPYHRVTVKPMLLCENDMEIRACFVDWRQLTGTIERTMLFAKEDAATIFPELDVTDGALQECWHGWAASRRIPLEEYGETRLTLDCHDLRVEPTPQLSLWLREHRADAYNRETWLWLGTGELRQPVRLDLKPTP